MLTQYLAVREIGAAVFPTELVTIISVLMVMSGPSLAYAVADRVSERALAWWGALTVACLLTLPIGIRLLTAFLVALGAELIVLLVVFLLAGLFTSAFFAIFLPRLAASEGGSFPRRYALELAGALTALAPIGLGLPWHGLLLLFYGLIVLVVHLGLDRPRLTLATAVGAALLGAAWPTLDARTMEFYCRGYLGMKNPRSLAAAYSPYQRVDVVQNGTDRLLLLDGIEFYGEGMLHQFNFYIADLPGRLVKNRRKALVIGAGSLNSTAYLIRQGFSVVTIDLDPVVAEFGMTWFADWHRLRPGDFELRIGDARRWLAERSDERFDLVVIDVPAAYHLQTSLLYTPEFLTLVRDRLDPDGLFALNTTGSDLADPSAASVISGACRVFPALVGVKGASVDLVFLYGGRRLPMTIAELKTHVAGFEPGDIEIYSDVTLRTIAHATPPHTTDRLVALLATLQARLPGRSE